MARGIALEYRHHIRTRHLAKVGLTFKRFISDFPQNLFAHLARSQFHGEPIGQRTFHCRMVEQAGMYQSAHQWLGPDRLTGFVTDPLPNRIDCGNTRFCLGHDGSSIYKRF